MCRAISGQVAHSVYKTHSPDFHEKIKRRIPAQIPAEPVEFAV